MESPKSPTLIVPSASMKQFDGLTSRCSTPSAAAASTLNLLRFVDSSHPALAEQPDNLVTTERTAWLRQRPRFPRRRTRIDFRHGFCRSSQQALRTEALGGVLSERSRAFFADPDGF